MGRGERESGTIAEGGGKRRKRVRGNMKDKERRGRTEGSLGL